MSIALEKLDLYRDLIHNTPSIVPNTHKVVINAVNDKGIGVHTMEVPPDDIKYFVHQPDGSMEVVFKDGYSYLLPTDPQTISEVKLYLYADNADTIAHTPISKTTHAFSRSSNNTQTNTRVHLRDSVVFPAPDPF